VPPGRPQNRLRPGVRLLGGGRDRILSRQDEAILERLGDHGLVVTPNVDLAWAVSLLGDTGGRILLTEGTHTIRGSGPLILPASSNGIQLVGISNEMTVLKRTETSNQHMVKLSGSRCSVENIRFEDTASTAACVNVAGSHCRVRDCIFGSINSQAIKCLAADFAHIVGNRVLVTRSTDYAIYLTGTAADSLVSSNFIGASVVTEIRADNGISRSSFLGNCTGSGGITEFFNSGGQLNVYAGNTGTVSIL
jgi:hypothetical protein